MLAPAKIYPKMLECSSSIGWPIVDRGDLEQDELLLQRAAIDTPNREYIWVLRENGTCLIPLYEGVDICHVTNWESAKFYHVVEDKLNPIPESMAVTLIKEVPFNISLCTSLDILVERMERLLGSPWSQGEIFSLSAITTTQQSWKDWETAFESSGNELMANFVRSARNHFNKLNSKRVA